MLWLNKERLKESSGIWGDDSGGGEPNGVCGEDGEGGNRRTDIRLGIGMMVGRGAVFEKGIGVKGELFSWRGFQASRGQRFRMC